MQRIISISLSILLFAALASEGFTILTFKVNQKKIVKEHCVNKAKPEMKCEGKCFLSRIFKQNDGKEDSGQSLVEEPSRIFLFPPTIDEAKTNTFICKNRSNFFYNNLETQSFYQSVFHPPDFLPSVRS